jgi:hypothetical protein
MWKWGWADYSQEACLLLFSVDGSFKQSLHGLSKSQIQKWFPDLRIETKPEQYLDRNQPFYISSQDFLWIGASQRAIEFEDGKVTAFSLIKGAPKPEDRQVFSEEAPSEGRN